MSLPAATALPRLAPNDPALLAYAASFRATLLAAAAGTTDPRPSAPNWFPSNASVALAQVAGLLRLIGLLESPDFHVLLTYLNGGDRPPPARLESVTRLLETARRATGGFRGTFISDVFNQTVPLINALNNLLLPATSSPSPGISESFLAAELAAVASQWPTTLVNGLLTIQSPPIILRHIALGPFSISLDPAAFTTPILPFTDTYVPTWFILEPLYPHWPTDSNGGYDENHPHPHISGNELCLGSIAPSAIRRAVAEGRLFDAFEIVLSVLRTYNPLSPHLDLSSWDDAPEPDEAEPSLIATSRHGVLFVDLETPTHLNVPLSDLPFLAISEHIRRSPEVATPTNPPVPSVSVTGTYQGGYGSGPAPTSPPTPSTPTTNPESGSTSTDGSPNSWPSLIQTSRSLRESRRPPPSPTPTPPDVAVTPGRTRLHPTSPASPANSLSIPPHPTSPVSNAPSTASNPSGANATPTPSPTTPTSGPNSRQTLRVGDLRRVLPGIDTRMRHGSTIRIRSVYTNRVIYDYTGPNESTNRDRPISVILELTEPVHAEATPAASPPPPPVVTSSPSGAPIPRSALEHGTHQHRALNAGIQANHVPTTENYGDIPF